MSKRDKVTEREADMKEEARKAFEQHVRARIEAALAKEE